MSPALSGNRAKSLYFAQPYSISATGFFFTDMGQYRDKAAHLVDDYGQPVEEFEIQYIDGDHADLFAAAGVTQATLSGWFDLLDALDGDEDRTVIVLHLLELGYPLDELSTRWDDYSLYHGTLADYAEEIVSGCYTLPANLAGYLDYERLGRDMVLEGSVTEIQFNLLLIGG
jgi:hypothetical protein